jgi:hypothetical protein
MQVGETAWLGGGEKAAKDGELRQGLHQGLHQARWC